MTEQWQELKETIIELRDSYGTGTQQEVCKFLANYMDVLEKQMQEPMIGRWIKHEHNGIGHIECSECLCWFLEAHLLRNSYCPNCGAKMIDPQESEEV